MEATDHYRRPGWFTKRIANKLLIGLTRLGVSVKGSRVLETTGRKSGLPRRVPVNLLEIDGRSYLVAPRGETEWVRNVRADQGRLTLLLGSKRAEFTGSEIKDEDKVPLIREYLRRWKSEVGIFFEGVGPDSPDADIAGIAGRHPVFRLDPVSA